MSRSTKLLKKESEENKNDIKYGYIKLQEKSLSNCLPVTCPLGNCKQIMGTTEIMGHYLRDHGILEFEFREANEGHKNLLSLDLRKLKFNTNMCLGMICYGGQNDEPGNKPVQRGLNRANSFLPDGYEKYELHLPILIMVCKTSTTCFLKNKIYKETVTYPEIEDQHVYILWLITMDTVDSMYCTITAFDKFLKMSRSKIIKVRKMKNSHDPDKFAACDPNCLLLRHSEAKKITHDFTKELNLELIIHEFNENQEL